MEESLSERQENELEMLQAIYLDGFQDVRTKVSKECTMLVPSMNPRDKEYKTLSEAVSDPLFLCLHQWELCFPHFTSILFLLAILFLILQLFRVRIPVKGLFPIF